MSPIRVQLSRKKGWRMPSNTAKVSRPSIYGNPFNATQIGIIYPPPTRDAGRYIANIVHRLGKPSLESCIDLYMAWLHAKLIADRDFIEPLRGKNLACWCPLDQPCHADVLLELANKP